jgi:tetratricopeptide (TPR) repeat protein
MVNIAGNDSAAFSNAGTFHLSTAAGTGTVDVQSVALDNKALGIFRDVGDRCDQAGTLGELGAVRRLTGDYPGAAKALDEALGICRDLGDRGREAMTLNEIGALYRVRGSPDRAEAYHRQALQLARDIGSPWTEADSLAGLGRCALAVGRTAEAEVGLREALETFQRIGAGEATGVAAEVQALKQTNATDR